MIAAPLSLDERFSRVGEGRYRLSAESADLELEVSHVRRERHQLFCELTVRSDKARTTHGVMLVADVNLSNLRSLSDITENIAQRTGASSRDALRRTVDELATSVLMAERAGEPAARLTGTASYSERAPFFRVKGFTLPQKLPAMIFGKGDVLKTYTALAIAVELDRLGISTLVVDGEMRFEDHDERATNITGGERTNFLRRIGCARPLVYEMDRIAEAVREHAIQYVVFDSVAFLVHDQPEKSDSALRYFQCVRGLGEIGSLHLAHRAKHEDGDKMPFGSAFWFNSVRALWYAERAENAAEGAPVDVAFYPRKFNVGAFPPPHGLRFTFTETRVAIDPVNPATVPTLAKGLSIQRRILELLRTGPLDADAITEALDEKEESVTRILRKFAKAGDPKQMFVRLADGRYANCDKRHP